MRSADALGAWAKISFATVVLHGVVQYAATVMLHASPLRTATVAAIAGAYVLLACSDRLRNRMPTPLLMAVQNVLGFALPWVSAGQAVMAPLAVISLNGFFLPAGWVLALGALHTASALVVCKLLLTGVLGEQVAYIFVVAAVFVAAFTKAVVSEMRLRVELDAASKVLARHAAQAETLATLAERERIARELHDSLGHALVASHVLIRVAERDLTTKPERALEALGSARAAMQSGLDDLRATVRTLKAPASEPLDLRDALRGLVEGHRGGEPVVALEIRGEPGPAAVPQHVALALLRVAQEALTNVIKHARASRVDMELQLAGSALRLSVRDDGRGIGPAREGFGLAGMRARIGELGGELAIEQDGGTRVVASVQLQPSKVTANS